MQVTIDGPASSGKSTVAKIIAKKLGYLYIDTGAMYRILTLYCLNNKLNINDSISVFNALEKITYETKNIGSEAHFFVNGTDVTKEIRMPDVAKNVSKVSSYPLVRKRLVDLQRQLSKNQNVVMDGRDIGTVVLPDADFKFFLTATPEVRAERRFIENQEKGIESKLEDIIQEIKARDELDSTRKTSPLKKADDAILVDTSHQSIEQVISYMMNMIQG